MNVGQIIAEPIRNHLKVSKTEIRQRVAYLMERVGLHPEQISRYPHEFSGGQRQRISIARALAVKPRLIVCDEAVSALDVSIQAQVVNLLEDLQERLGLTYLFIAHDLSMVRHICTRVAVMYLGKLCEIAESKDLYQAPRHPYTAALLESIPAIYASRSHSKVKLRGVEMPSPANPPSGCRFRTRCPRAQQRCADKEPVLVEMGTGRRVACHYPLDRYLT